MIRLIRFYDKHRKLLLVAFLLLVVINVLLMTKVNVNYDMAAYLPADSTTKQAITVLERDFDYPGFMRVLTPDVDMAAALDLKKQIEAVEGVSSVIWLDDFVNVMQPSEFFDQKYLDEYYLDGSALFWVEFEENDYSLLTGQAIMEIKAVIGDTGAVSGSAEDSRYMRSVLYSEIARIAVIVVPICVLILMFVGASWIEPLFYLAAIGAAIALNMGSNLILGEVSFLTQAIAAVLQLAVSLDYCLFLMHRYIEERDSGKDLHAALAAAVKKSFTAITASAMTTIAGFLALLFMRYGIGADMGLVLAKGIVFSFLCAVTLLPLLILCFHRKIDRTRHRTLMPGILRFGRHTVRARVAIVLIALLLAVPSFLARSNVDFLYGDSTGSSSAGEIAAQTKQISEQFGDSEPTMLLVPNDDIAEEKALCDELEALPYVRMVQGVTTMVGAAIPQEMLPDANADTFLSEDYSRIIAYLELGQESPQTFTAVAQIQELAEQHFPGEWLMAGKSTATDDIRATVSRDSFVISFVSILAVGLIILLTFRSLSLPVLLVLVIELSIWINMAIPYFQGRSLVFIGYLVVSSIQLGATIDYAILMSTRYVEFRHTRAPKQAAIDAVSSAGTAIMTSALILTVAGMAEFMVSEIASISEIGLLLGRGAALSGFLVLVLLPPLLVVSDRLICATTLGARKDFYRPDKKEDITEHEERQEQA